MTRLLVDRRRLIRWSAAAATAAAGVSGAWGTLARALGSSGGIGLQDGRPPQRFVLIFLDGGWNAYLSVDPVFGDRLASGNYEDVFATHELKAPVGKGALLTGVGFQEALPAFGSMPTAFVNGLDVAIAAHDAAAAFMLTGKNMIGRTVTEPAVSARIGTLYGGIGSHVVLGGGIPLGTTVDRAPPLQSSGETLGELVSPPGDELGVNTRLAIENALVEVDQVFHESLGTKARSSLEPFRAAQGDLAAVFEAFGGKLKLTDELRQRYGTAQMNGAANFAAAYLALLHGLTSVVTIRIGNFDTHSNELQTQLPRQRQIATTLAAFVADLRGTPDPGNPSLSLADTTTIVMTSEFTRTRKFNDRGGTDHQNSSSAIVMGRGVRDGVVIGAVNTDGNARGWDGEKAVARNKDTAIDGAALVSTILDHFGMPEEATEVGERRIEGLFV